MLEPDLLRTFVAISRTGSFTAAAREVGRTQSAVSMQIRKLEETVGKPLLRRSSHGVELTSHGHLLLTHALDILRAHDAAMAAFGRARQLDGLAVVGMPDDYAPRLLQRVVTTFRGLGGQARIEIVSEDSETLLRLLAEGAVDLAFVTDAVAGGGKGPILHREPTVWVGPREEETHRLDPLPLAMFQVADLYRRWATAALDACGRRWWIASTSRTMTGVQAAVAAGLGVSAVAASSVTERMRVLAAEEGFPPLPELEVRLESGRGRMTPLVAALRERLEAVFGGLG